MLASWRPVAVLTAGLSGVLLSTGGLAVGASRAPASIRRALRPPTSDVSSSVHAPPSVRLPAPATHGGSADHVRAVPVAGVPGASTVLNGVSCASTTFCLAVGGATIGPRQFHPLVERWGGRTFSVVPSPTPEAGELLGVSCLSRTFCIAVGLDGIDAHSELWNGTGWRVLATPSPHTVGRDALTSISCISRTDCWSVGVESTGTAHALPLVEHWNGARWSLVASPALPTPQLISVDCSSASSCWIIGVKDTATAVWHPLVEHWNGHAIVLGPAPAQRDGLTSISCAGPTSCVASGVNPQGGLLLSLSRGAWHTGPRVPNVVFSAAACPSASSCFAAGGLTAHWDGRAWALGSPAVGSAGRPGAQMLALSCPTPRECIGVGGPLAGARDAVADVISD